MNKFKFFHLLILLLAFNSINQASADQTDESRQLMNKVYSEISANKCEGGPDCVPVRNNCHAGCHCVKKSEQKRLENNVNAYFESTGELSKIRYCKPDQCHCEVTLQEKQAKLETFFKTQFTKIAKHKGNFLTVSYGSRRGHPKISIEESKSVTKKNVAPGEIGYEFKFNRPLLLETNFVKGGNKGYGPLIIINDIARRIDNLSDIKNKFRYVSKGEYINDQLKIEFLPFDKPFFIINIISTTGGASQFLLYVLKDDEGNEYFVDSSLTPFKEEHYFNDEKDIMNILLKVSSNARFNIFFEGDSEKITKAGQLFYLYAGKVLGQTQKDGISFTQLEVSRADLAAILATLGDQSGYFLKDDTIYSRERIRKEKWIKYNNDSRSLFFPLSKEKIDILFSEFDELKDSQGFQEPLFRGYKRLLVETKTLTGQQNETDATYKNMLYLENKLLNMYKNTHKEKNTCPPGHDFLYYYTTFKLCFKNGIKDGPFEIWDNQAVVEPSHNGSFQLGKSVSFNPIMKKRQYEYVPKANN